MYYYLVFTYVLFCYLNFIKLKRYLLLYGKKKGLILYCYYRVLGEVENEISRLNKVGLVEYNLEE